MLISWISLWWETYEVKKRCCDLKKKVWKKKRERERERGVDNVIFNNLFFFFCTPLFNTHNSTLLKKNKNKKKNDNNVISIYSYTYILSLNIYTHTYTYFYISNGRRVSATKTSKTFTKSTINTNFLITEYKTDRTIAYFT